MNAPEVGQLLWRSCACDEFAKVLRVGEDDNGLAVLDIELVDGTLNDIFTPGNPKEDPPDNEPNESLLFIELPKGTPVIIRDVPYKVTQYGVELCLVPEGTHCWRCTGVFRLHWPGESPWGDKS